VNGSLVLLECRTDCGECHRNQRITLHGVITHYRGNDHNHTTLLLYSPSRARHVAPYAPSDLTMNHKKKRQLVFPEWRWLCAERDDLPELPAFLRRETPAAAEQLARVRETREALSAMLPDDCTNHEWP
jgi:hypothetical protein